MSRGWVKSDLAVGESVIIPSDLFIEGSKAKARLVSSRYIGEYAGGIIIDCEFIPCVKTNLSSRPHYKIMINWASIWSGQVKVLRTNGEMVRARREYGLPLGIGQYQGYDALIDEILGIE